MYDSKTGIYMHTINTFKNEGLYKNESAYYLKYNSAKGIYAIEKLFEIFEGNTQEKCFYYHMYLDLLFQSVGMIINRFKPHKRSGNLFEQAKSNRIEYDYNKNNYPLLNNKSFRNFIEHIDERDEKLIDNNMYNGTFNLIYPNMDIKTKKELLNSVKPHNNLLNLEDMTYTILDSDNKDVPNIEKKIININELKEELIKINKISTTIWDYLHEF